jgi:hypothetical protein
MKAELTRLQQQLDITSKEHDSGKVLILRRMFCGWLSTTSKKHGVYCRKCMCMEGFVLIAMKNG